MNTRSIGVAPIRVSDVAVGGHLFHLYESGDPRDPTIVFLHGSGPGATGLSNWEAALGAFGDRYHCLAPDIVGFGDSSHPNPPPAGMVHSPSCAPVPCWACSTSSASSAARSSATRWAA